MSTEVIEIAIVGHVDVQQATAQAASSLRALEDDVDKLTRSFQQSASITSAATKAIDKAGQEAKKAATGTGRFSKELHGLERLSQSAGGRVGELSGRLKNFAEGLSILGGPAGIAVVASAAVGGLATAAAATTSALFALNARALESVERLSKIGMVTGEQAVAIKKAAGAIDGIKLVVDDMTLAMATQFAPATEHAARLLIKLGLAGLDAFNGMGDVGQKVADFFAHALGRALLAPLESIKFLLRSVGVLGELFGNEIPLAMDKAIDKLSELQTAAGHKVLGLAFEKLNVTLDVSEERVDAVIGSAGDLAKKLREAAENGQKPLKTATDKTTDSLKEQEATLTALKDVVDADRIRFRNSQAGQIDMAGFEAAAKVAGEKFQEAGPDFTKIQEQIGQVANITGFATDAVSALGDAFVAFGEKSKAATIASVILQKAAAIAQVAVSTAVGIAAALPTLATNPILGGTLIGLISATGAAQAAVIAAQKTPSFHFGGVVGAQGVLPGRSPGDVPAVLQVGERVQTPEEQARQAARVPAVFLKLGHRIMEVATASQLDDPRSRLGRMALGPTYGHRGFAGAT